MARRKRTSSSIERAQQRADGLASIGTTIDLGKNRTLADFQADIDAVAAKLSDYNTKLAELDGLRNELEKAEDTLDDLTSTTLSAIAVVYGKNSSEYEKAGGTRTTERKSSMKRATAASASAAALK
jgi:sugar phosphate isomerase/epimerase